MRSPRRAAALAVAMLGLLAAGAPAAWADGDPASDVLSSQDVYYPIHPETSAIRREELGALMRRVRADGLKLKVALIAGEADLGTQTKRFGRPRDYSELLGVELEVAAVHDYVLVAMPNGLATYRYDERGLPVLRKAIARLKGPGVVDADALARSAGQAVIAMAAATGHPVPQALADPFSDTPSGGPSPNRTLPIVLLGLAWLAAIAAAFALRVRRGASGPARSGSGDVAALAPLPRA